MAKLKPIIPANVDPIKLADEIKRGMTKKFFKEIKNIRKVDRLITKKAISKKEAIMIADKVKSGMSIKVMEDLEELKRARSKVLMVQ
ncbi:hypothetical protein HYX05_02985 [Candidatus Woesearchaeota archaeon]|nr:hypothetical protein [Candidatus Woesearchaeota archaeon]